MGTLMATAAWAGRRFPLIYHTRQAFSLTMGDFGAQLKACWNSGMFETTPFTR